MVTIESGLTDVVAHFGQVEPVFAEQGFELANMNSDHAYFDFTLSNTTDDSVYLRIPFFLQEGRIEDPDATIRFGQPFVIRHVHQTGVSEDAQMTNPLTNQFQEPVSKDADVSQTWVEKGKETLKRVSHHIKAAVS